MANNEIKTLKTNTFEEWRLNTNTISQDLGAIDEIDSNVTTNVTKLSNDTGSAIGRNFVTGATSTSKLPVLKDSHIDNTAGWIILSDSADYNSTTTSTFSGTTISAGVLITQDDGSSDTYSATVVSISVLNGKRKILVTNSTGHFVSGRAIKVSGVVRIHADDVVRLISESYQKCRVRVYNDSTEITQGLAADQFHVPTVTGYIQLTTNPDMSKYTEGSIIYQDSQNRSTEAEVTTHADWYAVVYGSVGDVLYLKSYQSTGYSNSTNIRILGHNSDQVADTAHLTLVNVQEDANGFAIRLNSQVSHADGTDFKLVYTDAVDAINELQTDIGVVENLTTTAQSLVGGINELDAEIGNMTLTGLSATTLSGAARELRTELGDVTTINNATGFTSTNAASGILELQGDVGDVGDLTTTAADLTGAINELDLVQGNATLTTLAQTVTGAVNELDAQIGTASGSGGITFDQGGPADLANNTTLMSAINTIDGIIGDTANNPEYSAAAGIDMAAKIGNLYEDIHTANGETLNTDANFLVGGINELETALRGTGTTYTGFDNNAYISSTNIRDAVNELGVSLGTGAVTGNIPVNAGSTAPWIAYTNVFGVDADGVTAGAFIVGVGADQMSLDNIPFVVNATTGDITMGPNTFAYSDLGNDYQDGNDGGRYLVANALQENRDWRGGILTISGDAAFSGIDSRYSVKAFIVTLDAANNHITVGTQASVEITSGNSFTVTATIPENVNGSDYLPQIGFSFEGVNAKAGEPEAGGTVTLTNVAVTLSTPNFAQTEAASSANLTEAVSLLNTALGDKDSYNDGFYGAVTVASTLDKLQSGVIGNDEHINDLAELIDGDRPGTINLNVNTSALNALFTTAGNTVYQNNDLQDGNGVVTTFEGEVVSTGTQTILVKNVVGTFNSTIPLRAGTDQQIAASNLTGMDIVDSATTFTGLAATNLKGAIQEIANTSLTAGDGLSGGGNLQAGRTFTVGAASGGGITVNADDIEVDNTVLRTTTSAGQSITQNINFGPDNLSDGDSGNTLLIRPYNTLDIQGNLQIGGATGSTLTYQTSFFKVAGSTTTQGIQIDRTAINVGNTAPYSTATERDDGTFEPLVDENITPKIQWNEGNVVDGGVNYNPDRAWQTVSIKPNASTGFEPVTADIVTFYNAADLVTNSVQSGLSATWNEQNQQIDFSLDDTAVTAGTYGSPTQLPSITVDSKGRVTGASTTTITTTLRLEDDDQSIQFINLTDDTLKVAGKANQLKADTNTELHTDGNFVVNQKYRIVNADASTDWNTIAGTTGFTYTAGMEFTAVVTGSSPTAGSGTANTVTDTITIGFDDASSAVEINLVEVTSTQQSTGSNNGALVVDGGVGIAKNLHVGGDLHVEGTQVIFNTETMTVDDNSIILNDDKTDLPVSGETGGIEINRGTQTDADSNAVNNAVLRWKESTRPVSIDDPDNPGQTLPAIPGSWQVTVDGITFHDIITEDTDYDHWTLKATSQNGGDAAGINIGTADSVDFKVANTASIAGLSVSRNNGVITYSHADTSAITGTQGTFTEADATVLEDGSAISSITIDGMGHMTGVTSVNFDDRYLRTFAVQDDDGDSVAIGVNPWKFVEGTGDGASINIDWSVETPTGENPFELSFSVTNDDKGSDQLFFRTINVVDTNTNTDVNVQAELNEDTVKFQTGNTGLALTGTTGDGATSDTVTFTNTDRGSSQTIFKSIKANNVQQAPGTDVEIVAAKAGQNFEIVTTGNTKWANIVLGDAQSVSDNLTAGEQTTLASSGLTLHTPGTPASRNSYGSVGDIFVVGAGLDTNDVDNTTGTVRYSNDANGLVFDGSFVNGKKYKISVLGQTNWNDVAGTSSVVYEVGDIIDAVNAGTILSTANSGLGQLLNDNHQSVSASLNSDAFGFIGNNNGVTVGTVNDNNNFIAINHGNTSSVVDRATVAKQFISGLKFDQFGHTIGFETRSESGGTLTLSGGTALDIATANNANKFDADASADKTITIDHANIPTTFSTNADSARTSISLSLDRDSFIQNSPASELDGVSDANDIRSDNHGLLVGDKVSFTINSGQLDGGGLVSGNEYYVRWVSSDGNYFQLAGVNRGTAISIIDSDATQTSAVDATIAMVKPVGALASTITTNGTTGAPAKLMAITGLDRDSQGHINKALTTEFTLPNYSWTIIDDDATSHVVRPGTSSLTIDTTEPAVTTGCTMSATLTGSTLNLVATNTDKGSAQDIFKKIKIMDSHTHTDSDNLHDTGTITAAGNNDEVIFYSGTGIDLDVDAVDQVVRVRNSSPNVTTNLSHSTTATTVTVNSSDGTNAELPAATSLKAGVMTNVSFNKLAGLGDAEQATSNVGTITGVSGGTGLSGSGTSGSVTLNLDTDQRLQHSTTVQVGNLHENIMFDQAAESIILRTAAGVKGRLDQLGHLVIADNITAFGHNQLSDRNLKENIEKVDGALELVSQLDGVTFNWKKNGKKAAGVIAQEVEKVLPSAVEDVETLDDKEHKVVDYNQLSALFIEAIKELKEENKQLRADLEELKNINN